MFRKPKMGNRLLLILFLLNSVVFAQTAISGYIDLESNPFLERKVNLVKIEGEESSVGFAPIGKDGRFSFDKKHISNKNTMYRIYVNRVERILKDTMIWQHNFILSDSDHIHFSAEDGFNNLVNTNKADKEWKKLKVFQERISSQEKNIEDTLSAAYATKLKAYAKDSLKILMVKLIGIRQLDEKGLLTTDIDENPDYYLELLSELKKSDLDQAEYLFLQKKMAYLTQEVVEAKYTWSKSINVVLGLMVAGLLFLVIRLKSKTKHIAQTNLSRQEKNIQRLILQGKTNKEIANELFISLSTVKTHITNIYTKLQVSNRNELVRKMQKS